MNSEAGADLTNPSDEPQVTAEEVARAVDRIVESAQFRGSHALQRLLRYVTEQALQGTDEALRESVIAAEVFHRRDFDPRVDTVVRVQAHRMRTKLRQFYEESGAEESLRIEVPAGGYVPVFRRRPAVFPVVDPAAGTDLLPQSPEPTVSDRRSRFTRTALLGGAAALIFAFVAGVVADRVWRDTTSNPGLPVDPQVAALWKPFLTDAAHRPLLVFATPVFLSNEKGLIKYNGPWTGETGAEIRDPAPIRKYVIDPAVLDVFGPVHFNHTYASVGYVSFVHKLATLFAASGVPLELRSSRALTADDRRNYNLIVAARDATTVMDQMPFAFVDGKTESGSATTRIVNRQPRESEPKILEIETDSGSGVRKVDYGILAILPGTSRGQRTAICTGLGTGGMLGAVDFATSARSLGNLERALGKELPQYFQAVIRTELEQDQVKRTTLVMARYIIEQEN